MSSFDYTSKFEKGTHRDSDFSVTLAKHKRIDFPMLNPPFFICVTIFTFLSKVQGFCGDSIKWSHNVNIEDVYGMWYGVGYAQHTPDMTNKPNEVGCVTLFIADASTELHEDWLDWSLIKRNYSDQNWRSDKSLPWSDISIAGSWLNVRIKRNSPKKLINETEHNKTSESNFDGEKFNTNRTTYNRYQYNYRYNEETERQPNNKMAGRNIDNNRAKNEMIDEKADTNISKQRPKRDANNDDSKNNIPKRRTKRNIYNERRIKIIWDEDGQSLEQTYVYTPEAPGLWVADKRSLLEREMKSRGIEIWYPDDPPRHPQVIRILKATPHSLIINHCSELGGGGIFSLILQRSPSTIKYWEWYNIKRQLFNFDLPNIHRYTTICAGCVGRSEVAVLFICLSVVLRM